MAMTPPQPKSNNLITMLTQLYADNFVTYYKSHGYHFNVEGPMFAQDHALLEEIYDFLWAQHDMLGEQIRQMDKGVPCSLKEVLSMTDIAECDNARKPSKEMFTWLNQDFDDLVDHAQKLYDEADIQCYGGLATLVGDYIKDLSKLNWKVKATLGKSFK
jgi:starvation-inducible DNA-binding protein